MYSFTIAAVVLVTGVAAGASPAAEFVYVKNNLKFETLEECKNAQIMTGFKFATTKAADTVGYIDVTECEEVK